ncbi:MAG: hypothetical protein V2A79_06425 [Planctomycetota bacterium]
MQRNYLMGLLFLMALAGLTGCQSDGGGSGSDNSTNDNTPDNANDNTTGNANDNGAENANDNTPDNTNANDNPASDELTPEQQAAIDAVVAGLETLAEVLAGLSGVTDLPEGSGTIGTCPVITFTHEGSVTTVVFDFGEGCLNELYGDVPYAGTITGTFNTDTREATLVLDEFAIDGQSISGSVTLARTADPDDGNTWVGTVDLTSTETGSVEGTAVVSFDLDTGIITIPEATMTITDPSDTAYEVSVADLVFDPADNGNYVPESGTLSFEMPNEEGGPDTVTVVITFDSQSPVDGTVQVEVGGAPPVEYTLPGFEDVE